MTANRVKDRLTKIAEQIDLLDDDQELDVMQQLIKALLFYGLEAVVSGSNSP